MTACRIDPREIWVQVTIVSDVVCTEYLCTGIARCCSK
jgi:hypothetical protein